MPFLELCHAARAPCRAHQGWRAPGFHDESKGVVGGTHAAVQGRPEAAFRRRTRRRRAEITWRGGRTRRSGVHALFGRRARRRRVKRTRRLAHRMKPVRKGSKWIDCDDTNLIALKPVRKGLKRNYTNLIADGFPYPDIAFQKPIRSDLKGFKSIRKRKRNGGDQNPQLPKDAFTSQGVALRDEPWVVWGAKRCT